MTWLQFSIKILGVHFGNSVIDNSNWNKISHTLTKKNQYLEQSYEKKKCKSNPLIQIWYLGQIETIPKFA